MYLNNSTRSRLIIGVALFVFAGLGHAVDVTVADFPVRLSAVASLIYCGICIISIVFFQRNIANKAAKISLMLIGALLLIWHIISIFEATMFVPTAAADRFLWYAYYIPTNFLPNLLFFAAYNLTLPPGEKPQTLWKLTFIISTVLSILALTNDRHQLVLYFPGGVDHFNDGFSPGASWVITICWIAFLLIMTAHKFGETTKVVRVKRYQWVIYVSLGLVVFYVIWWILWSRGIQFLPWIRIMYDDPDIWMALFLMSIEILVRTGIIKSNFNYQEFFEASTISASIVNTQGQEVYSSANVVPSTYMQKAQALDGDLYLDDNLRLHGKSIRGGAAYWVEDLSSVNTKAKRLAEIRDLLRADSELIKAETDMIKRMSKADEQNKLYNMLAGNVLPQLEKIDQLIHKADCNTEEFKQNLAKACIYKVFVKRYSNLMLLSQDGSVMHVFDITASFRESADYLKLNGITTSVTSRGEGKYLATDLIGVFTAYQKVLEAAVEQNALEEMKVSLIAETEGLKIKISMKGPGIETIDPDLRDYYERANARGGGLEIRKDAGQLIMDVEVPAAQPAVKK